MENLLSKTGCICSDPALARDTARLQAMLHTMLTVRLFEQQTSELQQTGQIHGTSHLCIGEEAVAVGSVLALEPRDQILVTHRGHGQAIAKGCDITLMFAELLGKEHGICRGRGGSMHMADTAKGVLSANGIVGANTATACGAALTSKMKNEDRVTVVFLGDGAINQGVVHESMNLAAAWNLPLIFCIIDNGYGYSTPLAKVSRETDFARRAAAYGIPVDECDGNDVLTVYETARRVRKSAAEGGPCMLVLRTYRTCGHSKSDTAPGVYRAQEEIDAWEAVNPIVRFKNFLLQNKLMSAGQLADTERLCRRQVEDALARARAMADPDPGDAARFVYA